MIFIISPNDPSIQKLSFWICPRETIDCSFLIPYVLISQIALLINFHLIILWAWSYPKFTIATSTESLIHNQGFFHRRCNSYRLAKLREICSHLVLIWDSSRIKVACGLVFKWALTYIRMLHSCHLILCGLCWLGNPVHLWKLILILRQGSFRILMECSQVIISHLLFHN